MRRPDVGKVLSSLLLLVAALYLAAWRLPEDPTRWAVGLLLAAVFVIVARW